MGKFIRLVKNEYIKLMMKTGTIVMLILLCLSAVGLSAIAVIGQKESEGSAENISDITESYQSEINYLKDVKTDGWEKEVELNQYLIDNAIPNDWRTEAADIMFEIKYNAADYGLSGKKEELEKTIDTAIANKDWKTYFQTAIELSDSTESLINNADGRLSLYKYCLDNSIAPYNKNWKFNVAEEYEASKWQIEDMEAQKTAGQFTDTSELEQLKKDCKRIEYRLDHNIEFDISENTSWMSSDSYNFWSVFLTSKALVTFVSVIVIIVAGGIISGEFSSGTIKFLMINPVKRWKILSSKYFTAISFGYIAMLGTYIVSILSSMLFFGADNIGASFVSVSGDTVKEIPGFLYAAQVYLVESVKFVVMGSLAFAISSLFRSSAMAIGISVMALLGGNTVTMILAQLQFDWGRYLIFANLSLSDVVHGDAWFAGQTLTAAIAVIAVHMVIFLLTAWDGFTKREI